MFRVVASLAGLLLCTPLAAREALPALLDCAVTMRANWISGAISANEDEDHSHVISLNTRSGTWFLRNLHGAALASDGGVFTIVHDGSDHPAFWLGLGDGGAMQMRIAFLQPGLPFLFVGQDNTLSTGGCLEPDEPFLFLR